MESTRRTLEANLSHVAAVITGGAGGLGAAMTRGLLAHGARVLAVDLDPVRLSSLRESVPAPVRPRLGTLCVDLASPEAASFVLTAAEAALGALNTLIANAGVGRSLYTRDLLGRPPAVWAVSDEAWDRMIDVNLRGPIRLINAVASRLEGKPWGRIVTVTTSLDHMLAAGSGPYGPSKAALEAYTSILARELAGSGITANVLVPGGVVDTPMVPELPGLRRDTMLAPEVMLPPLRWLLSRQADHFNCARIRAHLWNENVPVEQSLAGASAPAGWWSLAQGQQRRAGVNEAAPEAEAASAAWESRPLPDVQL